MLRISIAIVLFAASFMVMSLWDSTPNTTQQNQDQEQIQLAAPIN